MSVKQRRQFLKNFGALGIGLLAGKVAMAEGDELHFPMASQDQNTADGKSNAFTVSILQTTDVHCQTQLHDDLFW